MQTELADGFEPLSDRPKRLYDIWDHWRGARAMPSRKDVMPEELRDLLRCIVLMQAAADPTECRYIISGTEVDRASSQSLKGRTIREVLAMGNLTSLAEVAAIYGNVIATRQPSFSRGNMEYRDRGYISFDRVLLPLSTDGQSVDYILCGFFYNLA
jgi:hypothetical protein